MAPSSQIRSMNDRLFELHAASPNQRPLPQGLNCLANGVIDDDEARRRIAAPHLEPDLVRPGLAPTTPETCSPAVASRAPFYGLDFLGREATSIIFPSSSSGA